MSITDNLRAEHPAPDVAIAPAISAQLGIRGSFSAVQLQATHDTRLIRSGYARQVHCLKWRHYSKSK